MIFHLTSYTAKENLYKLVFKKNYFTLLYYKGSKADNISYW